MNDAVAARLIDHVMRREAGELDAAARRAIKVFVLDTLGVTLAGRAAEWADEVHRAALGWGAADDAHALGHGTPLPAPAAAFVNAYNAHNQEFDCVHEPAVVHPMATVHSAALAVAERRGGVDGRSFMTAISLGVDVATTIGCAATTGLKFFRPAAAGVFGATAAAALLLGLDREQTANALGLAFAQCSGTMQAHREGKPTLALNIALAARAAVQAVDLARLGFPGPAAFMTGPFGYLRMMEDGFDLIAFEALGKIARITEVSHKPFPSGRATHGGVDGILQLRNKMKFLPEDIEKIELFAPPLIQKLVGRPLGAEMTANYARLCFQYVGALAAGEGEVPLDGYSAAATRQPARQALAAKVAVIDDGNPDPNALAPQRVVITLRDGQQGEVTVADTFGAPANALSDEENVAKFRRCCAHGSAPVAPAQVDAVVAMVADLEAVTDMRHLVASMTPAARR